jgi:hypothetical protein
VDLVEHRPAGVEVVGDDAEAELPETGARLG